MTTVSEHTEYHNPVLADKVREMLLVRPDGVYLDGTLGGGGHAWNLLRHLSSEAIYIGIDRDTQAIEFARKRLAAFPNVRFYHGVFADMDLALRESGIEKADGILLDLGISSHQVDDERRGFTFRPGVALDMRMNPGENVLTAADILNTYDYGELFRVFREYGEERHTGCIARRVIRQREEKPFTVSDDLVRIIDRCVPRKHAKKSYARIFQALRIEVNGELEQLKTALEKAVQLLRSGGRLVVISYHSLEDRIVKNFLRKQENPCECPPELPVCQCGKLPTMKRVRPFLVVPDEKEIQSNPRARSAKMRVGERL